MATYTQTLYQIVFSTKNREFTLMKEGREHLFRYVWGILKNKKYHLYRINGMEDSYPHSHQLAPYDRFISLDKRHKSCEFSIHKGKPRFFKFQGLAKWLWRVYLFVSCERGAFPHLVKPMQ